MRIQVVYARAEHQEVRWVELADSACLGDALTASGLLRDFPEIDLVNGAVGVSGKVRSVNTPLREGDQVEFYRPRTVDPKLKRRERLKV